MKLHLVSMLLMTSTIAIAQTQSQPTHTPPQKVETRTVASVLERNLSGLEREFVSAAEAMPEDKYAFVPTSGEFKGVRNFGEQARHVAATNYLVFAAMLGEAPPADTTDDNGPAAMKSKAEIVKYLKDSFALGHRAVAAMNEQNLVTPIKNPFGGQNPSTRLGAATMIFGHCFDHYGQMVEYLRMNGIIPPASRQQ